jgi:hypothetical protein
MRFKLKKHYYIIPPSAITQLLERLLKQFYLDEAVDVYLADPKLNVLLAKTVLEPNRYYSVRCLLCTPLHQSHYFIRPHPMF